MHYTLAATDLNTLRVIFVDCFTLADAKRIMNALRQGSPFRVTMYELREDSEGVRRIGDEIKD